MTGFTIQEVSRRSGLSEPALHYYEEVGLVGPIDRDEMYHARVARVHASAPTLFNGELG